MSRSLVDDNEQMKLMAKTLCDFHVAQNKEPKQYRIDNLGVNIVRKMKPNLIKICGPHP